VIRELTVTDLLLALKKTDRESTT